MSEVRTEGQPPRKSRWLQWADPPEKGSKAWFWQMRVLNIHIWLTPLIVLAVAATQFRWPGVVHPTVADRLLFSLPWVSVAVSAVALGRALWRIEINMEGGERPFTEKDSQVYASAMRFEMIMSAIVMLTFLVLIFYILIRGLESHAYLAGDKNRLWTTFSAMYPPMGAMYLLMMFTQTLKRTHAKAREYYEELEKGV